MQRHAIAALLVVSILGSTMLVGCSALDLLTGSDSPLFGIAIIPVQILGALLLDQFVGPLFGDPAGDLNMGSDNGANGASPPIDN